MASTSNRKEWEWSAESDLQENEARRLKEAIEGQPNDNVADYRQAVSAIPELVAMESPPARFLRAAGNNANAAAARLSMFWKKRREMFGPKALNPITATGQGALSKSDLEVLQSGVFVQLPNDSFGSLVFGFDRSRLDNDFDDTRDLSSHVLRCAFYVLTAAAVTKTEGACVLLVICGPTFRPSSLDTPLLTGLQSLFEHAIPYRYRATKVVVRPPRVGRHLYVRTVVPHVEKVAKKCVPEEKLDIIVGRTISSLLEELQDDGFRKDGIPTSIGGAWGYFYSFADWQRQRAVYDRLVEASFRNEGVTLAQLCDEEDAKQRKRKLDVMYAKRMRVRRKEKGDQLRSTLESLRNTNHRLTKEYAKLQKLKKEAEDIILNKLSNPETSAVGLPITALESLAQTKTVSTSLHTQTSKFLDAQNMNMSSRAPLVPFEWDDPRYYHRLMLSSHRGLAAVPMAGGVGMRSDPEYPSLPGRHLHSIAPTRFLPPVDHHLTFSEASSGGPTSTPSILSIMDFQGSGAIRSHGLSQGNRGFSLVQNPSLNVASLPPLGRMPIVEPGGPLLELQRQAYSAQADAWNPTTASLYPRHSPNEERLRLLASILGGPSHYNNAEMRQPDTSRL